MTNVLWTFIIFLCSVIFILIMFSGYRYYQKKKKYKKCVECTFKIGDVFKVNDFLSHNMLWLFMVYNDLLRTFYYYKNEKKNRKSIFWRGRIIYILRLDILHIKEAVDMIRRARGNKSFSKLIRNIPVSYLKILNKNTRYGGIKIGTIYDNLLVPLRKSIGHYLDSKYLDQILSTKIDVSSNIIYGKIWGDTYFRVADEIIASYVENEIGAIKYKDNAGNEVKLSLAHAIEIILEMMGDFMKLVHEILLRYYPDFIEKHSTSKDIRAIIS